MESTRLKITKLLSMIPQISIDEEGLLKGGYINITLGQNVSTEHENFNCPAENYSCGATNSSSTYFLNVNCPQAEYAACSGSAQGSNTNCVHETYCGNTLPPTKDTTAPAKLFDNFNTIANTCLI